MSIKNWLKNLRPKGFLWKLTCVNLTVIVLVVLLSSWTLYLTACSLSGDIGNFSHQVQMFYNSTLFQYLLMISSISLLLGGALHFYVTRKMLQPIRLLISSIQRMKEGHYPEMINEYGDDEIGELIIHFNELIQQLKINEEERKRFVTDLSHEFRTPLANLNGYLKALHEGVLPGNKETFYSLKQESLRLIQMVEQLEQLKKWDHVESQVLTKRSIAEISETINHCVYIFHWALTKNDIPVDIQVEEKRITMDVDGIEQVIYNLLDNAIQYYNGDKEPITVRGFMDKDVYTVSVAGPSKPIREEDRDKIFQRFYRADASRARTTGGSGLGLAIANEIVLRHGGELGVKSSERINTFYFTIPLLKK